MINLGCCSSRGVDQTFLYYDSTETMADKNDGTLQHPCEFPLRIELLNETFCDPLYGRLDAIVKKRRGRCIVTVRQYSGYLNVLR
jgi:hypothetical protein